MDQGQQSGVSGRLGRMHLLRRNMENEDRLESYKHNPCDQCDPKDSLIQCPDCWYSVNVEEVKKKYD